MSRQGIGTTGMCDTVFGLVYEASRYRLRQRLDGGGAPGPALLSNMAAALLATVLSSPLNYARNIMYATPPTARPLTAAQVRLRAGRRQLFSAPSFPTPMAWWWRGAVPAELVGASARAADGARKGAAGPEPAAHRVGIGARGRRHGRRAERR